MYWDGPGCPLPEEGPRPRPRPQEPPQKPRPQPILFKQKQTFTPLAGAFGIGSIIGPGYGSKIIRTRRNDIYKYTTGGLINVPEQEVEWSSSIAFLLRVGNAVVQLDPINLPTMGSSRWVLELTFSFDDKQMFVISAIVYVGEYEYRQLGKYFDRPSEMQAEFDVTAETNDLLFSTTFGTLTQVSVA